MNISDNKPGIDSSTDAKSSSDVSVVATPSSYNSYTTGGAFIAGVSAEYYEPIAEYEGRHRYSPTAEWTEKEEKKLVRKVNLNTPPQDQRQC